MTEQAGDAPQIEPLGAHNQDRALDLLERFFREEGFTTPSSGIARNLGLMIADASCWGALARSGPEDLGVVTVTTMLHAEWGHLAEIGDLYVMPRHRGRGVARLLVVRATEWCMQRQCSAVYVTVTPDGEERQRLSGFYRHLRFEATGCTIMTRRLPDAGQ